VKPELAPIMARFRTNETQDARVTLDGPKLESEELRTMASVGSYV
jgi:hypothetical protein